MLKKKKILPILAIILITAGLWSCQWTTIKPVDYTPNPNDTLDTISFSAEIQPIFDSKCVACHATQSPRLTAGNSYDNLTTGGYIDTTDPENSVIYLKLKDEQHPSPSTTFTAAQLALLLQWITQGALNN
jgi:hypothetical protein